MKSVPAESNYVTKPFISRSWIQEDHNVTVMSDIDTFRATGYETIFRLAKCMIVDENGSFGEREHV